MEILNTGSESVNIFTFLMLLKNSRHFNTLQIGSSYPKLGVRFRVGVTLMPAYSPPIGSLLILNENGLNFTEKFREGWEDDLYCTTFFSLLLLQVVHLEPSHHDNSEGKHLLCQHALNKSLTKCCKWFIYLFQCTSFSNYPPSRWAGGKPLRSDAGFEFWWHHQYEKWSLSGMLLC